MCEEREEHGVGYLDKLVVERIMVAEG